MTARKQIILQYWNIRRYGNISRFYVDELLNDEKISLDEIQYIKERLEFKVNEIQDLTKITTNTLSEITHYTTVAIGPDNTDDIISDVKLVLLGNRILMAVILTESGAIKETIIKYDEDITENGLINQVKKAFKI